MRTTALLVLLLLAAPSLARATAQIPDEIVIDGESRILFTEPFLQYLSESVHAKFKPYLNWPPCTASWRGFRAFWRVEDAKLLLIKLLANPCDRHPTEIPLITFFPDHSGPVPATWYSGKLVVPGGSSSSTSIWAMRPDTSAISC